jgi:tartrate/fumarate subfamily iron-sulfur-dependent hydro-lyase beta chain
MNNITDLQLPISSDDAKKLKLGEMVTVSGMVFTGRSRFHIRAIEDNIVPPVDFKSINCFFHVGPVMKPVQNGWEVVSVEPTSSIRFEKYSPGVIRKLDLHMLIGKTTMGKGTMEALKEVGGVHLTKIGICGNQLSKQIKSVKNVYFLDELGKTEATWILEVEKFGPFFVDIDAYGKNYFQNLHQETKPKLQEVYHQLGIPDNLQYTQVNI